ncbi:site-specific DNA-methyltransferase [Candidatus Bathyarchaeota archaeon]|nr:site-specific DNA-methyltransferase [Candidatus Bathyarchaeota archaeon]
MVAMVSKALKRKEVELGFVHIPVKNRAELLGDMSVPFDTKLNDAPAKVDKYGRLWSEYLKNKFPISTEVTLTRNEKGFQVIENGQKQELVTSENTQATEAVSVSTSVPSVNDTWCEVLEGDCIKYLNEGAVGKVHLTFFDPPYLQGKDYRFFDDSQSIAKYWNWIRAIVEGVYKTTSDGGAIYFMHREKNAERVLRILRKTGWNFQNLIIWKKKTSAVPIETRFSKQYQIIAYAIKGKKPRVFNKVRINPPPLPEHKYQHENGVYLTDVWGDIRELTSGYFAGDEAFRDSEGNRIHVQQTPVSLLLRIILSSTLPSDIVFDPTAGTGTALVVAKQLSRNSLGIEIDPAHVELIKKRLKTLRAADDISSHYDYYKFTPNLKKIWQTEILTSEQQKLI